MIKRTSIVFFVILIVVLGWVAPSFWKVYELQRQMDDLEKEVQLLSQKNQTLENELRLLQDDSVYIEQIARKKFYKAREGEVIYKIVPAENSANP